VINRDCLRIQSNGEDVTEHAKAHPVDSQKTAEETLLREDEVAFMLRLGRTKVRQLFMNGDIPTVRIGRALRIRRSDLNRFIDRCADN
jgi:excisionase family DNA binding protein